MKSVTISEINFFQERIGRTFGKPSLYTKLGQKRKVPDSWRLALISTGMNQTENVLFWGSDRTHVFNLA